MDIRYQTSIYRRAKLMLAAVALRRTHGLTYAVALLKEHGIPDEVIAELMQTPQLTKMRDPSNGKEA